MQTFIFGLLLAGVSGVTIVAFRHTYGFARLFPYLIAVVTAVFAGFNIWHVAIEVAWSGLLDYIQGDRLAEANAANKVSASIRRAARRIDSHDRGVRSGREAAPFESYKSIRLR